MGYSFRVRPGLTGIPFKSGIEQGSIFFLFTQKNLADKFFALCYNYYASIFCGKILNKSHCAESDKEKF